ncbi:DEAD/DEAH box helicase [Cocleimonas flava]|uniref:ATP-dependent RNA helicase RhlE n=1 Tax=Cocleimonas flava TaxID=634765 RepID=A0A4R1ERY4_9GAMM|nr:DEAD/DEAH box helicase [Cocleimonas flava]TCJ82652.1 ATP-dependent RNA helicase RhlE [Cocleimonas flava]
MSFGSLGLCDELLKTVAEQGYTTPSPIQIEAIPAVLSQRDVMAVAHTGTGKTAGFTLPMVQLLSGGLSPESSPENSPEAKTVRALIIAPTRELAAQVVESVKTYSHDMNIRSAAVFGGMRIEPQIAELAGGLDILVATPGRLIDLYSQQAIDFDQLEILVLDEADRMLDLGFIDDIRHIQTLLPMKRQTLMFSATFSKGIKSFAQGLLNDPQLIEVDINNSTVDTIKQKIHPVDKERKTEVLIHLLQKNKWPQVLVFVRTKREADSLVVELQNAEINADSIHANRTQHARTRALEGFKDGSIIVLVATDIASRGIDVNQLPCVVNVDLPFVPEDYVHRIGRTGRAGSSGVAISLFSEDEYKQLHSIERIIGRKFEREVIPGFEPSVAALAHPSADEEYGNFEPDPVPSRKGRRKGKGQGKPKGRRGRGSNSSPRKPR